MLMAITGDSSLAQAEISRANMKKKNACITEVFMAGVFSVKHPGRKSPDNELKLFNPERNVKGISHNVKKQAVFGSSRRQ